MTKLYGFRIKHEDGSVSDWRFIDDMASPLYVALRQVNGAHQVFSDYPHYIDKWAMQRELKLEKVEFSFDPATMTFSKVS